MLFRLISLILSMVLETILSEFLRWVLFIVDSIKEENDFVELKTQSNEK